MLKAKLGQSIIEYVIIFAVVAAALIIIGTRFAGPIRGSIGHISSQIQSKVGSGL